MQLDVKVLVASEDAFCLNLLALVLQNQKNITLIGEAGNWRELSSLLTTLWPDVVLLDTDAPGNGAAAVIRTAKLKQLPTAFVGLVGEVDVDIILLSQLDALVLKSDPLDEMASTILAATAKGKFSMRMKGYQSGIKSPLEETMRQSPMSEDHKDLLSSPIWLHLAENPQKSQPTSPNLARTAEQATLEVEHQRPATSPIEASSSPSTPETVSTPAREKEISEGTKQFRPPANDNIECFDPGPKETQSQNGNDTVLAARLDAIRAALGSSHDAPANPAPPAASRQEAVRTVIEETAVAPTTNQVDIEPAQEHPTTIRQPNDGIESTLKEVLPSVGSIVLIVSPFANFRSLSNFQQALERLDGVRSVMVRRFQGGTLYAAVRYAGTAAQLESLLKDLVQFDPKIVETKPGIIELRINARD